MLGIIKKDLDSLWSRVRLPGIGGTAHVFSFKSESKSQTHCGIQMLVKHGWQSLVILSRLHAKIPTKIVTVLQAKEKILCQNSVGICINSSAHHLIH